MPLTFKMSHYPFFPLGLFLAFTGAFCPLFGDALLYGVGL